MIENEFDPIDEELFEDPRCSYPPLPRKLISVLIKRGVINTPVTIEQDAGLRMLQWAWEDKSKLVLRFMLSSIRKRDRELLVLNPQMGKIERYIYNCINNNKGTSLEDVKSMVMKSFGVDYPIDEIKKIRAMVYHSRRGKDKSKS